MKLNIKFLDNYIDFNDKINCVEIINKNYFYRIVNALNNISNGISDEKFFFFDGDFNEIIMLNKIKVVFDFFNFDFDSKKLTNYLYNEVNKNISDNERNDLSICYNRIFKIYKKHFNEFDFNIAVDSSFDIDNLCKVIKFNITKFNDVLNNLMLLIDIEKILNVNKLLVLINVKQYLNNDEIIELYKYSMYNDISLLLIDSISYGVSLEYESKLLIDDDLEEFIL